MFCNDRYREESISATKKRIFVFTSKPPSRSCSTYRNQQNRFKKEIGVVVEGKLGYFDENEFEEVVRKSDFVLDKSKASLFSFEKNRKKNLGIIFENDIT